MQIIKVAQGCRFGNQAEFVPRAHINTNQQNTPSERTFPDMITDILYSTTMLVVLPASFVMLFVANSIFHFVCDVICLVCNALDFPWHVVEALCHVFDVSAFQLCPLSCV